MRLSIVCAACAVCASAADFSTYIGPLTASSTSTRETFVGKAENGTLLAVLSGNGSNPIHGITVDPCGNIYVVGSTSSTDLPLRNALQTAAAPGGSGFLVKLSPHGNVIYSTYLGGTASYSSLYAVAADAEGNAYVTGSTFAEDYPRTPGLPASTVVGAFSISSRSAAFFAKISPAGDRIVYAGGVAATQTACGAGSSCFLSTISTSGNSIAVDPAGNAYISGNTNGFGLPATPGALRTDGIGGFVAKVNAEGTGLVYLTFLSALNVPIGGPSGANPGTQVYRVAADSEGNAYITGTTFDPAFPVTPGAFQSNPGVPSPGLGDFDAFVAKLNPDGNGVVWATYLGGSGNDQGTAIAIDPGGNVWVAGTTQSSDFPVSAGFPGGADFLVEFDPSGSTLLYGERFPSPVASMAVVEDTATRHALGWRRRAGREDRGDAARFPGCRWR